MPMSEPAIPSLEALECRGDFYLTFKEAVAAAGGNPDMVDAMADSPLSEIVDVIAQNGLRIVYVPHAKISADRQLFPKPSHLD